MKDNILIKNAILYSTGEKIDLLVEDGKIGKISPNIKPETSFITLDAKGNLICPGLIDIHIQGAGGSDILDGSDESVICMSKTLGRIGTTSFLGTTDSKPATKNDHLRVASKFVNRQTGGAILLGLHLEGPFINPVKKGGISLDSIYPPYQGALEELNEAAQGSIKMMTIAPEIPGCLDIIKKLKNQGTVAAFAHSNADYQETLSGFDAGIDHVTHIFNAMPKFTHRSPGPLGAIFENKEITAQIICDGNHIHPSAVRLVYNLLGPKRCVLITDGIAGMGLPEGKYLFDGREYISKGGAGRYLDGTLIGSTSSLLEIVRKFIEFTGCSLREAIDAASLNPARVIGIENKKGSIKEGLDADLIIMDKDFSIKAVIIEGDVID